MAQTNDPNVFAENIRKRGTILVKNVEKAVRAAAIAADRAAVLNTPVDTGRARENWIVTVKSPAAASKVVNRPKGFGDQNQLNANRSAATSAAFAQADSTIRSFQINDQSIHITNNVSYIGELDKGSSKQAPAGMSEAAIMAATKAAKSFSNYIGK